MFKDTLLAIILGTLLGFGLTGGYFAVSKKSSVQKMSAQSTDQLTPSLDQSTTVIPTSANEKMTTLNHQVTIDVPLNESIVANSKITVKGSTSPNSYIVITTASNSFYTQSDTAGNFNTDIEIDSGANIIDINSFDSNDNSAKASILVTYSTSKI